MTDEEALAAMERAEREIDTFLRWLTARGWEPQVAEAPMGFSREAYDSAMFILSLTQGHDAAGQPYPDILIRLGQRLHAWVEFQPVYDLPITAEEREALDKAEQRFWELHP